MTSTKVELIQEDGYMVLSSEKSEWLVYDAFSDTDYNGVWHLNVVEDPDDGYFEALVIPETNKVIECNVIKTDDGAGFWHIERGDKEMIFNPKTEQTILIDRFVRRDGNMWEVIQYGMRKIINTQQMLIKA